MLACVTKSSIFFFIKIRGSTFTTMANISTKTYENIKFVSILNMKSVFFFNNYCYIYTYQLNYYPLKDAEGP